MSRTKALSTLLLALVALLLPSVAPAQNQFERESSLNSWSTAALDIDFTTGVLDPRITFTRASTATRINAAGRLETVAVNAPRFDHDPVTLAPRGLLIEEARTNLVPYSEQFDNASWTKSEATISADIILAPDGTTTAEKLVESSATAEHYVTRAPAFTGGTAYTFSFFAKAGERSVISSRGTGVWAADPRVRFTLTGNGSVTVDNGSPTATITPLANGWYRCTYTATPTGTGGGEFRLSLYNSAYTYAGDGTSGLYVWGAQLEAGGFATSYIPTTTSSGSRSPDQPIISGANFTSWFNPVEGVFLADMERPPAVNAEPFSVWDGANAKGLEVYLNSTTTMAGFVADTTTQANMVGPALPAGFSTCALAYKLNDFAFTCNAGTLAVDSAGTVPTGLDRLVLGRYRASGTYYNARIRRLRYLSAKPANVVISGLSARIAQ